MTAILDSGNAVNPVSSANVSLNLSQNYVAKRHIARDLRVIESGSDNGCSVTDSDLDSTLRWGLAGTARYSYRNPADLSTVNASQCDTGRARAR
jgi:hypothetical protein